MLHRSAAKGRLRLSAPQAGFPSSKTGTKSSTTASGTKSCNANYIAFVHGYVSEIASRQLEAADLKNRDDAKGLLADPLLIHRDRGVALTWLVANSDHDGDRRSRRDLLGDDGVDLQ